MAQSKPQLFDVIECFDIFQELKNAQWLIQSMQDAIDNHWEKKELVNHLSFLISIYGDKIEDLIPRLDTAFNQIFSEEKPMAELSPTQVQD